MLCDYVCLCVCILYYVCTSVCVSPVVCQYLLSLCVCVVCVCCVCVLCVCMCVLCVCVCVCVCCVQIILLAIGRYFIGYIFTFQEMELMDSLIPAQLYPKCARKVTRREGVAAGEEALTFKLLSTAEKEERLGKDEMTRVGMEKHKEAMGDFGGAQVVVTQYQTPDLTRHRVGNDDASMKQSTSSRSTEV